MEPDFGAAWDAVRSNPAGYIKAASNVAKGLGAGMVIANVALTGYVVNEELNRGTYNTHTFASVGVTDVGVG